MKYTFLLLGLIFTLSISSFSSITSSLESESSRNTFALIIKTPSESKVYICGGQYAEKFHSYSSCRGLNNCKGGIYYINSQQEAINKGYEYCSICWR